MTTRSRNRRIAACGFSRVKCKRQHANALCRTSTTIGRPDVILFEGWCVGARPQSEAELQPPINELERRADPDARWRRYVNERLGSDYKDLFGHLDRLLMLEVPSLDKVVEWRLLQERR